MTLVHHPRTDQAAGEEPPARAPAADAASGTPPPAAAAPATGGTTFESLAVAAFVFGLFAVVVAVFAVGLAARAVDEAGDAASAPPAEAPAAGGAATSEVTLTDFAIDPADATVAAGTVLDVTNDGAVPHNLAVDGIASDMLDPGEGGQLDLSGLEPGTYTWICEVPGHESAGMTGTVVIE